MTAGVGLLALASFVILLPAVENVSVGRQVVQPKGPSPGSFYRGAIESPPPTRSSVPGFQRNLVEYRPTLDFSPPIPFYLRNFNPNIFLSQFVVPSYHVDHFRQYYPHYVPLPSPSLPVYVPDPNKSFLQLGSLLHL